MSNEHIQNLTKELLVDSVAQAKLGLEKLVEALELLIPKDIGEAVLVMRALSVHSTALKNYADTLRHLLPEAEIESKSVEFVATTLIAKEVAEIRAEQEKDCLETIGRPIAREENAVVELS